MNYSNYNPAREELRAKVKRAILERSAMMNADSGGIYHRRKARRYNRKARGRGGIHQAPPFSLGSVYDDYNFMPKNPYYGSSMVGGNPCGGAPVGGYGYGYGGSAVGGARKKKRRPAKRKKRKSARCNTWQDFLRGYRKQHPGMPMKKFMPMASVAYKKLKACYGGSAYYY